MAGMVLSASLNVGSAGWMVLLLGEDPPEFTCSSQAWPAWAAQILRGAGWEGANIKQQLCFGSRTYLGALQSLQGSWADGWFCGWVCTLPGSEGAGA